MRRTISIAIVICCLLASAAGICESDAEEIYGYGLNLPMDTTVYIPENVPTFSFGDIHIGTSCAIARNFDLIAVTLEEALGQGLEPCMSCAYDLLFGEATSAQEEMGE